MINNFTFNASIKVKEINKIISILQFMKNENVNNKDTAILNSFIYMLNGFNDDIHKLKLFDVLDEFATFYENLMCHYCKEELIECKTINEFEWEDVQYIMDKMVEIISHIQSKYGINFKG